MNYKTTQETMEVKVYTTNNNQQHKLVSSPWGGQEGLPKD